MLTAEDQTRIAAAVEAAEAGSSGEIVCVVAGEVSTYREVPLAAAAIVALALPPLLLALGLSPLAAASRAGLWIAAERSALASEVGLILALYAGVQTVLFIAAFLVAEIPAVRRALTPRGLKQRRVARLAQQQFAAIGDRAAGSQTGVLIFVAPVDRVVQVLADQGIHDKAGETPWRQAADAVGRAMKAGHDPTSGIVEAIDICGAALRAHFPAEGPHQAVFQARPLEI
ncbi:MAG: TPM domain-containing protein [Caulobacteraceae bacterium]|nr:TPM domain-containing protein [Caulobacteraceae bacterium]